MARDRVDNVTRAILRRWALGVVVTAAALVVALALISANGGNSSSSADRASIAVGGLPQAAAVLGRPDAPIEIVEFADLQCPFCRQASVDVVPDVVERWVRPGTARLRFVALSFIGPDSVRGARAAVAAGTQHMLWPFIDRVYARQGAENSGWLSDRAVDDIARQLGLDLARFDAERTATSGADALQLASTEARQAGVQSTPSFVINGPRETRLLVGVPTPADVAAAIEVVR